MWLLFSDRVVFLFCINLIIYSLRRCHIKGWGRIRRGFGPSLTWVNSWFTGCRILRGIVWKQNKAICEESRPAFGQKIDIDFLAYFTNI